MSDESKHDERVGHFTPKGWSVVRRHRAALLKFAELAGAAGVDAVVQASKTALLPFPLASLGRVPAWPFRPRKGRRPGGLGAACTPAEERPRRGPESLPGGASREGEEGYNLLYP